MYFECINVKKRVLQYENINPNIYVTAEKLFSNPNLAPSVSHSTCKFILNNLYISSAQNTNKVFSYLRSVEYRPVRRDMEKRNKKTH